MQDHYESMFGKPSHVNKTMVQSVRKASPKINLEEGDSTRKFNMADMKFPKAHEHAYLSRP
jgi:hypothetical protein